MKNIEFQPNLLKVVTGMYRKFKNSRNGKYIVCKLPDEFGVLSSTYTDLPVSDNGYGKIWNAKLTNLPIDIPANILLYRDIVVGIELIPTGAESIMIPEYMNDNHTALLQHAAQLECEGIKVYSDLNGIYWEAVELNHNNDLTEDGALKSIAMSCIFYNDFNGTPETALTPKVKYAICYETPKSLGYSKVTRAVTAPIFKNPIGNKQSDSSDFAIDAISKSYRINLNFMISKSLVLQKFVDYEELDRVFGIFDIVDRLGVDSLPKLPKSTKAKYPIGLSVKNCIIWLLGLQTRYGNDSMENLEIIRASLKFLLQKSLTKEGHSEAKNLYNEGFNAASISLKSA